MEKTVCLLLIILVFLLIGYNWMHKIAITRKMFIRERPVNRVALIPGGKMDVTIPKSDGGVHLDYEVEPFVVSRYLVTIDEYLAFVNDVSDDPPDELFYPVGSSRIPGTDMRDPSVFHDRSVLAEAGMSDLPITNVTWVGAMLYCEWLSDETYEYRLPWEYEWEYLASNGGTTKFTWGDKDRIPGITSDPTCYGYTALMDLPVGSIPQNGNKWGVYDLIGSAEQWCLDVYTDLHQPRSSERKDVERGQAKAGVITRRMLKGGTNVPSAGAWWGIFGGTSRVPSAYSRWRARESPRSRGSDRKATGFRWIREERKQASVDPYEE